MSDSAPPPPPPENQGGATPPPAAPPPPPPPASPYGSAPPPASPYGSAPPPPGAVAGAQPGQLLERFVARLIDGILVGVVGFVIGLILGAVLGGTVGSIVSSVVTAVIYLGYFVYLESSRGQTLGKQIMSLRVVGASGSGNPTTEEALKRNIWTALGILGIVPVIGTVIGGLLELAAIILIVVTINSDTVRRQSWFDTFAGGTQVLKQP